MKNTIYIILVIAMSAASLPAYSDDTEIHLGNSFSDLEPNVVFIMDTSTSMSWATDNNSTPPSGQESRLDIVKRIAIDTINNTQDINISLMSFNGSNNQGATLDLPLTPIENARSDFTRIMDNYSANGGTPLTESLDEALRYLRGDQVKYGASGVSSAMNSAGTEYKKPIKNQCQKNHVILFSDGDPSVDTDSNEYIRDRLNAINDPRKAELATLASNQQCSGNGIESRATYSRNYGRSFSQNGIDYTYLGRRGRNYEYRLIDKNGICAEEIALLAQLENFSPDPAVQQNVTIHTVGGFVGGTAQEKLKNIAKFGSPTGSVKLDGSGLPLTYYSANSATELATELEKLFNSISNDGSIFTAPSVSVNAFNSLELSDELYYAVFKPNKKSDWAGNLKRYRLELSDDGASILGQDDLPAINNTTGFFKETALSFWSDPDQPHDGLEVTAGGMAQHLALPRDRIIKTVKDGKLVDFVSAGFTDEELNIVGQSSGYKARLLEWARGIDVNAGPNADGRDINNELIPRLAIEDPLHSEPTIINYSSDKDSSKKDRTLFLGTNSGFLHAFDVDEDNPKEYFSFIPKELIKNLDKYYSGGSFYDNKTYGIDGPLTHWHEDINDNGQVDNGEQVYLYITLRRGGQSFYALNVTNRLKPELLWQMHGDYPDDFPNKPDVSDDFSKLGQTWARLEPATVMWKGEQTTVLFTAGGYDPIEDGTTSNGPSSRSEHTLGTTIYMLDALTGKVLWDASIHSPSSAMTSSFAANVSPVDSTSNGLANIVFAADTGGRVWRFDINAQHDTGDLSSDFATSHLIADISTGSGTGNRRFFNEVDVIYREQEKDILLSIGSGYRAHPLSLAVTDYNFIIKTTVNEPTSNYLITADALKNWGVSSAYGWKIPLTHPGEKVLSRSSTAAGAILFTTFAPKSSNAADLCSSSPGIATLYILNNNIVHRISLVQGGIPAMPVIVRNTKHSPNSTVASRSILIGTEVINLSKGGSSTPEETLNVTKDYWLEER
ncbi:MAG: type IV pilus assembly protein PilY1 [Oleispira sp.]|jgi:type IV pilus assembly protein PilY1